TGVPTFGCGRLNRLNDLFPCSDEYRDNPHCRDDDPGAEKEAPPPQRAAVAPDSAGNSGGYYDHDQQADGTEHDCSYLPRLRFAGFANLTPGLPPSSAMSSTPARSMADFSFPNVASRNCSPASNRTTVSTVSGAVATARLRYRCGSAGFTASWASRARALIQAAGRSSPRPPARSSSAGAACAMFRSSPATPASRRRSGISPEMPRRSGG